jgi:phosphopantetheinyl transferase (holo-ACP synthase)
MDGRASIVTVWAAKEPANKAKQTKRKTNVFFMFLTPG